MMVEVYLSAWVIDPVGTFLATALVVVAFVFINVVFNLFED